MILTMYTFLHIEEMCAMYRSYLPCVLQCVYIHFELSGDVEITSFTMYLYCFTWLILRYYHLYMYIH